MNDVKAVLRQGLAGLGLAASAEQVDALERYLSELLRWNQRINLTAARTVDDAARHVLDSAAIVAHIPEAAGRLLDVGSGGGLPAAVIAVLRPEIEVVAIEPVHKKHAFLQQVRRAVPTPNLTALAERIADHEGRDYDVATSRATFALPEWLAIGSGLVRAGGLVLGMEGAEQIELPPGASRHPYPLDDRARAIIVLRS
ncbi:MAG: 16S rRNA (guanine(527)-N(7))-methyltransferase RsmG [Kofleriaceae bacterium]|nr:16S rRNA (guanine(527)-N(7))-methyltransferase RsmG [Myxococcales bacterium]MCB9559496.1 16S rRNA (guanine(527)-N(7))-methyltransferase RsmG [Kofleriaceae bacterium]